MSGIDQLLALVVAQGANELRLGIDEEPQMFDNGKRKRLTMAATSEFALRHLLSDLLTPEREARLASERKVQFDHDARDVGHFRVHLTADGQGAFKVQIQSHETAPKSPQLAKAGQATAPELRSKSPYLAPPVSPASSDLEREASSARAPSDGTESARASRSPNVTCTEALRELVLRARECRASDIHLIKGERTYFRVDGKLRVDSRDPQASIESLLQLSEAVIAQLDSGASVDESLEVPNLARLRLSLYRDFTGTACAIRLLPSEAPELEELGLPVALDDLLEIPHGLILVCGATGSGKSTTLAALAKRALARRSQLLITLEDPIEFVITPPESSLVRRRQVGRDVPSFHAGLRDALRADPDLILVGELRDAETIQLALTAAETGHLILASMHSGGAASAVERLVDAYPADQRSQVRVQLASALRAVVSQKLIATAKGVGRVAALEVMRVTHAVSSVIREGRTAQIETILQSGKREGMLSFDRCLADYVQSGTITLHTALAEAQDRDTLKLMLGR